MKIRAVVKSRFKFSVSIFCAIAMAFTSISPSIADQSQGSKFELSKNADSWSLASVDFTQQLATTPLANTQTPLSLIDLWEITELGRQQILLLIEPGWTCS